MTSGRVQSMPDLLASRPLTDSELERRYGQQLRRSDDWFEVYGEPPIDLPLSPRRKYLLPVVGLLVAGAAVLTGYALQKNDWRAISDAQTSLQRALGLEAPGLAMEPLAERDSVQYVSPVRPILGVTLSTASAETSYERALAPAPEVPAAKPEPKQAPRRRAPEPKPRYQPPAVSEGSPVIEAPMAPERADSAQTPAEAASETPTIEAPIEAQPEPTAPGSEPRPSEEPAPPSESPANPPVPDYGI